MPPDEQVTESAIDGFGNTKEGADATPKDQDLGKAFKSTQAELHQTRSAIEGYKSELARVQARAEESGAVVEKLRDVFNPKAESVDPTEQWAKERDHYIRMGIDAEKAGRPMPLTIENTVRQLQDKIDAYAESKANAATIKELKDKIEKLTDPERETDHRAAANINSVIIDMVERLYGQDDASYPTRAAQYNAISEQVRNEALRLQKDQPKAWAQVRRSSDMQAKLVEHVVSMNQPPKVRQMLEQERLKNTPVTMDDLNRAFADAKKIEDPGQREKHTAKIRQQMWEIRFAPKNVSKQRPSMSQFYGK
jgi:hypothetical protein